MKRNKTVKDANTLPDVQLGRDERGVELNSVGIRNVSVPIQLQASGSRVFSLVALVSVGVSLAKELKGTHMSRFMTLLTEFGATPLKSLNIQPFLEQVCSRLQSSTAHISFDIDYMLTKAAPVSGLEAPMSYKCRLIGGLDKSQDETVKTLVYNVIIPSANLCPCSKAISDYGAHNQRMIINVSVSVDPEKEYPTHWMENLIFAVEEAGSCPLFPILKRADEKYVTERQYDNPKFVEDVVRDGAKILQDFPGILGFKISAEALESIHAHNAWATYSENFPELGTQFSLDPV